MKNVLEYLKTAEQFAANNSPAILTGVGVVGTVATAALTGKATLKADRIIREKEHQLSSLYPLGDVDFSNKEKAKLVWKQYIPPTVVCTITVVSIVSANRIGGRRTAALAAAYTIAEKGYSDYREKVIETFGEKKEQSLRDSVAQDRVDRHDAPNAVLVSDDDGLVLCYDAYTDRYFRGSVEGIKKAQNDTNHKILAEGYQSLNDFYLRAGLGGTSSGEEVGWTADKLLDVEFSTCMSRNANKPAISIDFRVRPVRDFHRMN
jgi:hypothetical protein